MSVREISGSHYKFIYKNLAPMSVREISDSHYKFIYKNLAPMSVREISGSHYKFIYKKLARMSVRVYVSKMLTLQIYTQWDAPFPHELGIPTFPSTANLRM